MACLLERRDGATEVAFSDEQIISVIGGQSKDADFRVSQVGGEGSENAGQRKIERALYAQNAAAALGDTIGRDGAFLANNGKFAIGFGNGEKRAVEIVDGQCRAGGKLADSKITREKREPQLVIWGCGQVKEGSALMRPLIGLDGGPPELLAQISVFRNVFRRRR
jgi:hypothetical protein